MTVDGKIRLARIIMLTYVIVCGIILYLTINNVINNGGVDQERVTISRKILSDETKGSYTLYVNDVRVGKLSSIDQSQLSDGTVGSEMIINDKDKIIIILKD